MSCFRVVILCAVLARAIPALAEGEGTPGEAPPGEAAAATAPALPDLRARPPVLGMADLRELSTADPVVRARYEKLEGRRKAANVAAVGSVLGLATGGVLAAVISAADVGAQINASVCSGVSRGLGGGDCRKPSPDFTAAYVALGVGAALGVVTFVVMPHRSDLDDAVALWNARHPDDVVGRSALARGSGAAADSLAARASQAEAPPPGTEYCPPAVSCPIR